MNAITRFVLLAILLLVGACGSTTSDATPGEPALSDDPTPTGFRLVVDAKNRGAALFDLVTGEAVVAKTDADVVGRTTPSVWLEPTDPEIAFIAVTVEEPERFDVDERGGEVKRDQIASGAAFEVKGANGQRFRVEIVEYIPGDRDTARFVVQVDRL